MIIVKYFLLNKWLLSSEQLNLPRMILKEEWYVSLNIYQFAPSKSGPEKSTQSSQMTVSPEHPKKPPFPRHNEH